MPRTRHEKARNAKIDDIIRVAEGQLRAGGFAALSIPSIARELGLANNAVYWYFPNRDHLAVAVGHKLVRDFPKRVPPAGQTVADRAVWIVGRIAELQPLLSTMRERAAVSEVVAAFERDVSTLLKQMMANLYSFASEPPDDVDVAVEAFWSAIEGVLHRRLPRRTRDAVVRFTVDRFLGSAGASALHPADATAMESSSRA